MSEAQKKPLMAGIGGCNGYTNEVVPIRKPTAISEVGSFCYALGGKKPINSILIANNGMAAVKFIRSIRTWAYETFGTEKAILLVAMATPEDMRINAEHIIIADQFVEVPGGTNDNNYANVQLILEMAERTHVDAVWPGWGHASENTELPDALDVNGIVFLGPPSMSMGVLGDKIGLSLIAQAAEVPTLPWSGSHVKISPDSCLISIPDETYREACVYTTEEAVASCQIVGYPALIKASWGGDGKGTRKVCNDNEVRAFYKQVQSEVPGSPIFVMKLAPQNRHLEVQLICDQYGNVAALHSQDCSVQRRHQKVIDEGPITVVPLETVKKMEQAARRLARCVNFVGAATLEYLYIIDTGEYYFLELIPHLQVQHPVTEWIAEINLPAAQVAVGMGIPLWQIPEIRRFYGMEHGGGYHGWRKTSALAKSFDFDKAESIRPKGHCVAVRITSDDPDDSFTPTSGKVQELSFNGKPNVWAYFSVKSGGGIHEFSDSQFGHVFAFGDSRTTAIANMIIGLKEIQIRGEIRTNVDYIINLLDASDYRDNIIHTGWLDSGIAKRVRAESPPWYLSAIGGALFKASASNAAMVSDYVGYLEKDQIPPKHLSLVYSETSLNIEGSQYTIDIVRGGPGNYKLRMNGSEVEAEIHTLCAGGLLMQLGRNSHVMYAEEDVAGTRLLIDERSKLLQNHHDPSKLIAETPCKLLRYLVSDRSHIEADLPYAEVEVMKMCMPLRSPASGVILFKMSVGQAVQAGELIARLELDDPSAITKAEPFHGSFPILGPPTTISDKVHHRCAASLNAAQMILAGYERNIDEVVQSLLNCLNSPELPFLQWQESFAVLANRLPRDLKIELESKFKQLKGNSSSLSFEFPAKILLGVLEAYLSSCPDKEKQERLVEPLMSLVKSYEGGRDSHSCAVVQSLFEEYLSIEELFSDKIQADVIEHLRVQYKEDPLKIVDIVLSHQGVKNKNKLVLRLVEQLVYPNPALYKDKLIRFSALNNTDYSDLLLKVRRLLGRIKLSELGSIIIGSFSELEMFIVDDDNVDTPKRKSIIDERMEDHVNAPVAVEDALVDLFDNGDPTLQRRVVETYIRRLYQPCLVKGSVRMQRHRATLIATWEFFEEHAERRNVSLDLTAPKQLVKRHSDKKWGAMIVINSMQVLPSMIVVAVREATNNLSEAIPHGSTDLASYGNTLHVALIGDNNPMGTLLNSGDEDQAQERMSKLAKILKEQELGSSLRTVGVGVISCIIQRGEGRPPMRHSFHWSTEKLYFEEEPLLRHLEPPLSNYLELDKLKGYENIQCIPSQDRQWHIYAAVDKPLCIQRMFLRTLVRQPTNEIAYHNQGKETTCAQQAMSFTSQSILVSLRSAMNELELHAHSATVKWDHAHIYLYITHEQQMDDLVPYPKKVDVKTGQEESVVEAILEDIARDIHASTGVRMHMLGIGEWEMKFWLTSSGQANGAWRTVVTNVTGHAFTVHIYREIKDTSKNGVINHSVSASSPLHGLPINARYQSLGVLDQKRLLARRNNTTYCYDFPLVFETALENAWSQFPGISRPKDKALLKLTELVFTDPEGNLGTPLVPIERQPGLNDVGMVGWSMEMSTPEFPSGRTILVVANDVTFKAGSFGPRENVFFHAVTNLACNNKLPLIYLAANSGARLGVAEEVKACFKVGWSDDSNPDSGFQYIYLTPEDYAQIRSSVIAHKLKLSSGETRWVIDTIVGKEDGLGVENLTKIGAVSEAYSRAYKETFTLTYVTGRAIGIGAYLARFGMRCIQRIDQPIILTGFSALNKLLGREVYSSHMQLGGPKIMGTNGVVHLTVSDDLEGASAILKWLSYIPPCAGGALPVLHPNDLPERPVGYIPEHSCDPRAAIAGALDSRGEWAGGIFDRDSFVETLEGWARTCVTGRARLGGIPIGIVAVETQTVTQVIPADPGQVGSQLRVIPRAGQVWFPDSATKTAQAVMDFNREGLPLFILANWRGFSGGQGDLYEGVLQAGSTIVENLRNYKQPVIVYIPIMGELRGGAWVVIDSQINSEHIEMYADPTAKGSVLEPEGMIEIKFRKKDLLECMGRLDQDLVRLKAKLKEATCESLQEQIRAREKQLLPVYTEIATRFAALHDTSQRMAVKGVIRQVVEWATSRYYFCKRLRRRMGEESLIKTIRDAGGDELSRLSAKDLMRRWFLSCSVAQGREDVWEDDEAFFTWKDDPCNYQQQLEELVESRNR